MMYTFGKYYLVTHIVRKRSQDTYLSYLVNEPEQKVILKIYDAECLNPNTSLKKFQHIATLFQQLSHPHIVPVRDIGLEQGKPYVVSEYFTQGSLRQHLESLSSDRLRLDDALRIVFDIGEALSYAHKQKLVHQNIKPENIFLNAQGEASLADFSLKEIIQEIAPGSQPDDRTLSYMAPEQLNGQFTASSDQYALGCLLYELVTGVLPFTLKNLAYLWQSYTMKAPTSPSEIVPGIAKALETVILKALSKNPADRYPDITSFLKALETATQLKAPSFPFAHILSDDKQKKSRSQKYASLLANTRSVEKSFEKSFKEGARSTSHLTNKVSHLPETATFSPQSPQVAEPQLPQDALVPVTPVQPETKATPQPETSAEMLANEVIISPQGSTSQDFEPTIDTFQVEEVEDATFSTVEIVGQEAQEVMAGSPLDEEALFNPFEEDTTLSAFDILPVEQEGKAEISMPLLDKETISNPWESLAGETTLSVFDTLGQEEPEVEASIPLLDEEALFNPFEEDATLSVFDTLGQEEPEVEAEISIPLLDEETISNPWESLEENATLSVFDTLGQEEPEVVEVSGISIPSLEEVALFNPFEEETTLSAINTLEQEEPEVEAGRSDEETISNPWESLEENTTLSAIDTLGQEESEVEASIPLLDEETPFNPFEEDATLSVFDTLGQEEPEVEDGRSDEENATLSAIDTLGQEEPEVEASIPLLDEETPFNPFEEDATLSVFNTVEDEATGATPLLEKEVISKPWNPFEEDGDLLNLENSPKAQQPSGGYPAQPNKKFLDQITNPLIEIDAQDKNDPALLPVFDPNNASVMTTIHQAQTENLAIAHTGHPQTQTPLTPRKTKKKVLLNTLLVITCVSVLLGSFFFMTVHSGALALVNNTTVPTKLDPTPVTTLVPAIVMTTTHSTPSPVPSKHPTTTSTPQPGKSNTPTPATTTASGAPQTIPTHATQPTATSVPKPTATPTPTVVSSIAPIGKMIWLKAGINGLYVSAQFSGTNVPIEAVASAVSSWEQFIVVDAGGGNIALKVNTNHLYVSANPNTDYTPLIGQSSSIGTWETFRWVDVGNGNMGLQSLGNGYYVSARTDTTNTLLRAQAHNLNSWETFQWGLLN